MAKEIAGKMPSGGAGSRGVGRVRNTKTPSTRNNKLENKMTAIGAPYGYGTGMGAKTVKGKEVPIVEKLSTGSQAKIKGSIRNLKENTSRAIAKVDGKPFESISAFNNRMRTAEKAKAAAAKPKAVPVKPRANRTRSGKPTN